MMPYILHVSLLITIVVLFYKLILEKETHYRWNRWILLSAIVTAFVLPLFTVPASWSIEPFWASEKSSEKAEPKMDIFIPYVTDIQPIEEDQTQPTIEAPILEDSEKKNMPQESREVAPFLLWIKALTFGQWLLGIYLTGAGFFALRLIIQMGALFRQIKILPKRRDGKYVLLEPRDEKASYSFFHYIFINPVPLDNSTYKQILMHEKIHADHKHSLDILLAELLIIFQWFNPFSWAYRKALRQNLEYLTDDIMVQNGADMTDYQLSLLRVSAPEYAYTMVANYNQSLLKKRILMMNAKKSSFLAGWKYLLLFSALCLSIPIFNAKAKDLVPRVFPETQIQSGPILIEQGKAPEDEPISQATEAISENTIPQLDENASFSPPLIINSLDGEIRGTWEAMLKDNEVCMRITRPLSENEWNWTHHNCFAKRDFSPANFVRVETFKMTRDAGSLIFTGEFIGKKGEGNFEFVESTSYQRELTRKGVKEITPDVMFRLFFTKKQEAFVDNLIALSSLGLPAKTLRTILPEGIPADLVKAYIDEGLSITKHLNFVRSRVKPGLLKGYMAAGLDLEEHKNFIHSRVKPDLLNDYRIAGFDLEENKNFIHSRVKPDLLKGYRAAGLDLEEHKNFINSRVKPDILKEYIAAGFNLEEHKSFIHSHVKPDILRRYKAAGLDLEQHKNFIHSRVKPELLKGYLAAGFDLEENKNFIHSHVKPDFLRLYKDAGLDLAEHKNFIHSHVKPEFLKGYMAAGLDLEKHKNFIHSHVKPQLLKDYRAAGFDLEAHKNFIHSHVKPDFLKRYQAAGLDFQKHKNYIHSHVKPELLKDYMAAGLDLEENKNYIHSHTKASFLKEYIDAGYNLKKHKKFIQHHIRAEFLQRYEKAGLSIEKHEDFILDRMDPEKVKKYRQVLKED